jgi:LytS/YehU family sensor histidine kinase
VDVDKENSRKFAELELSALRGQMNPHFVFNALGAIQYYIHTHDVELADDYLTKFALLMRKYLESSRQKMISVRGEMELIKLYTDLEILRFESKFKCTISSDPELELEDEMIPSMLIQPFIENAIKHGLNDRMDKLGRLTIHFGPIKNGVKVRIEDNGVGFEKGLANRSPNHQSRGMQIIKEKVNTLEESGLAKVKIQYETLDIENKEFPGTVVILTIEDLMTDEYV